MNMIHAFLPDCSGTGPCSILYHKLEILHAVYYQQSPVHTLASKSNSMPTDKESSRLRRQRGIEVEMSLRVFDIEAIADCGG